MCLHDTLGKPEQLDVIGDPIFPASETKNDALSNTIPVEFSLFFCVSAISTTCITSSGALENQREIRHFFP